MNSIIFRIILFTSIGILCAYAAGISEEEFSGKARQTISQWTWGTPTNGIVGGIYVGTMPPENKTEYSVFVHGEFKVSADSFPPTFYSEPNSNALPQGWFLQRFGDTNLAGRYFKATNYFCGPMVLLTSDGAQVPPRNPGLVSFEVYPQSFHRSELGSLDAFHAKMASPLAGRLPQLSKFKLDDLFEIKKPGDYVLTVWPKIYRQIKNDDDLCERIDLLPVSVKVQWGKDVPK